MALLGGEVGLEAGVFAAEAVGVEAGRRLCAEAAFFQAER